MGVPIGAKCMVYAINLTGSSSTVFSLRYRSFVSPPEEVRVPLTLKAGVTFPFEREAIDYSSRGASRTSTSHVQDFLRQGDILRASNSSPPGSIPSGMGPESDAA